MMRRKRENRKWGGGRKMKGKRKVQKIKRVREKKEKDLMTE